MFLHKSTSSSEAEQLKMDGTPTELEHNYEYVSVTAVKVARMCPAETGDLATLSHSL